MGDIHNFLKIPAQFYPKVMTMMFTFFCESNYEILIWQQSSKDELVTAECLCMHDIAFFAPTFLTTFIF